MPTPRLTKSGQSFAQQRGRLWEITPWMPGVALPFGPVNESRRTAILAALAVFHTASAAARRGIAGQAAPGPRLSPGLLDRRARLERALTTDMGQIRDAPVPDGWHELAARRDEFFRLFAAVAPRVQARLGAAAAETGELIPCIRDIRREHLLFSGEQLTGWVDFGALRDEHPAADLARVLGEFFDDRPAEWDAFVAEYRRLLGDANTARISMAEIQAFDQSGILLGPLNWLRWIFLEYRDFVDRGAVVARFDQLLTRLRRLAETT